MEAARRQLKKSRPSRASVAVAALFVLLIHPGGMVGYAAEIDGELPEDVLIFGSSLVRGLKRPLKKLLRVDGSKVKVRARAPLGWLLSMHAMRRQTDRALLSRDWDYVFMAEQSGGIATVRYPGARDLHAKIVDLTTAQPVFLMTWRGRGEAPDKYDSLRGEPGGGEGYVPIAFELDAPVAPAGWAFLRSIVEDGLPLDLWQDGHHLNRHGEYLVALIMYAVMTGNSTLGQPWPRRVTQEEASYLQSLAMRTVFDSPDDWNLDSNSLVP